MTSISKQGPLKFNIIETQQYFEEGMSELLRNDLTLINNIQRIHQTRFNNFQNFLFCTFRKIN